MQVQSALLVHLGARVVLRRRFLGRRDRVPAQDVQGIPHGIVVCVSAYVGCLHKAGAIVAPREPCDLQIVAQIDVEPHDRHIEDTPVEGQRGLTDNVRVMNTQIESVTREAAREQNPVLRASMRTLIGIR